MIMDELHESKGVWVPCDSRASLLAELPPGAAEPLTTDSPNTWGYVTFDTAVVIPIGYSDLGLLPVAVMYDGKLFVGIDELLVAYDSSGKSLIFKYTMPTVFHEFVRFEQDCLIVRDEIGFAGISFAGVEKWSFWIDVISDYEIRHSMILGKTEEGQEFKFTIPTHEI